MAQRSRLCLILCDEERFWQKAVEPLLFFPFCHSFHVAQGNRKSTESEDRTPWKALIADLEKQIPNLMEEARLPGLSITIIKDAKLVLASMVWRQRQHVERTC